jgi:8-oxo-dGTP diphosphatase
VSYEVWSGQSLVDKTVDWWAMTVAEVDYSPAHGPARPQTFAPSDEVDDLAWMPTPQALEVLTYDRDRWVVRAYADLPAVSRPVVLLGDVSVGDGDPSSAEALADLIALLRPGRLISAQPLPCGPTLADLAQALAIEVEIDARFDGGADPDVAATALRSLANDDTSTVVCGQPAILTAALARLSARPESDDTVATGDALVLSFSGDRLVAADQLTPDVL